MAFWYRNSNGLGISPENNESEIVEDYELEDISPGTYETVSEMVIARWGELWLLLVEKATLGTDGKLTFTLRNGTEIEV